MIFVVGIPRSGTTWTHSLLAAHPSCERLTPEMLGIEPPRPTRETHLFLRGWTDDEIRRRVDRAGCSKILVEKTPQHLTCLHRIRCVFPDAKIVLIRRRRADVLHSMVRGGDFWPGHPKAYEAAVRLYEDLYTHQEAYAAYDHELRYEKLWEDPIDETREMYRRLGLSEEPAEEAVAATRYGRNLSEPFHGVYRDGRPGQGSERHLSSSSGSSVCSTNQSTTQRTVSPYGQPSAR